MYIIINRYSPRSIQLKEISAKRIKDCIVIAPIHFQKKYEDLEDEIKNDLTVIYLDDFVLPKMVQTLRDISKKFQIIKIVTLCEEDVFICGILNDYFLNKNTSSMSSIAFKDKYVMRSLLTGIIKQPYFRLINSLEDIEIFFKKTNTDFAIIKPRDGAGASGVKKITKNDIENPTFFNEYWIDKFMIEEFVTMDSMLTCDGYSIDSNIERAFFHEYDNLVLDSIIEGKDLLLRTHKDYFKDNQILKRSIEICTTILKNFSVAGEVTPFHFELFFDRKTGEIIFCEVGKRFGGGEIPTLILNSFGVNLIKEYWDRVFNTKPSKINRYELEKPRKISGFYQAFRANGVVKYVPAINDLDWITIYRSFVEVGENTTTTNTVVESVFLSVFTSSSEKEYKEHVKYLRKLREQVYQFE
mgnify:CR=1 FL=1